DWVVGIVGIDARQRGRSQHLRRRFDFPEHLLGFRVSTVVQILDLDDVQASLLPSCVVWLDGTHGRQAVANLYRLSDLWESCFCCCARHSCPAVLAVTILDHLVPLPYSRGGFEATNAQAKRCSSATGFVNFENFVG